MCRTTNGPMYLGSLENDQGFASGESKLADIACLVIEESARSELALQDSEVCQTRLRLCQQGEALTLSIAPRCVVSSLLVGGYIHVNHSLQDMQFLKDHDYVNRFMFYPPNPPTYTAENRNLVRLLDWHV